MNDFSSIEAFNSAFINMSSIISEPDFVTYDDKHNSLLFIKKILDTTLVATRVTFGKEMKVKPMYPINHAKIMRLQKHSKTKIMD